MHTNGTQSLVVKRKLNRFRSNNADGSGIVRGVAALVVKPSLVLIAGPSTKEGFTRTNSIIPAQYSH